MAALQYDIILVTGEEHEDHPYSPSGVIARVLMDAGYRVGVIEKPESKEDYNRLGKPALCFGVTSGSIDSMLLNYTPLKRRREIKGAKAIPDRALIVYCNRIREYFKQTTLVIGGIEASMRRFAHYDYWDDQVRRSILLDSRADILVYGNGEKQIVEICSRLRAGEPLAGIAGTCMVVPALSKQATVLPAHEQVAKDADAYCQMQEAFGMHRELVQPHGNRYVVQYPYPRYTSADLDAIFSLPFSRKLRPGSFLRMAQFSIQSHRGCWENCHFCSLALHQGERIVSRSEASLCAEAEQLTRHADFKGYIDDVGGPTANMYGVDCGRCTTRTCKTCPHLNRSQQRITTLLRQLRKIPGVKKAFVRSGINYELALADPEYLAELSAHHISGCLKIAPEHVSERVLRLMNKSSRQLDPFIKIFARMNARRKQYLRFYFMIGHPGDTLVTTRQLVGKLRRLRNIEQFQLFVPLPMTVSACMYWSGKNPYTGESVEVVRDFHGKKELKRLVLPLVRQHSKTEA
ncbi:MAG TPA: YgiQ family radical SAM protein [bacterium]|nr:YgiQ family radical SAM protein [bacterium]